MRATESIAACVAGGIHLVRLPHMPNSVLVRSIFGRYAAPSRPGDASVSRLETVDDLLREHAAGRIRQYADIASR